MDISEGNAAPDFALDDADGNKISLKGLKGKYIALYFYPKDDTPGCTKEACNLRDNLGILRKNNVEVIGVSLDDMDSHKKFMAKYTLPFTLLCDTGAEVSKKYGVYVQKSMYGKKFWGIARTTFLINPQGKIRKIFRDVDVEHHSQQILDAIKG